MIFKFPGNCTSFLEKGSSISKKIVPSSMVCLCSILCVGTKGNNILGYIITFCPDKKYFIGKIEMDPKLFIYLFTYKAVFYFISLTTLTVSQVLIAWLSKNSFTLDSANLYRSAGNELMRNYELYIILNICVDVCTWYNVLICFSPPT